MATKKRVKQPVTKTVLVTLSTTLTHAELKALVRERFAGAAGIVRQVQIDLTEK